MSAPNLIRLTQKNLLYSIEQSINSRLFQRLYVKNQQTGKEYDVMKSGELSCAYFVSALLALHGLIDRPHATVDTTLTEMMKTGWVKTDSPKPGNVIFWPEYDGHTHIGFMLNYKIFVSNDEKAKTPQLHGPTLRDGRQPKACYTHPLLNG